MNKPPVLHPVIVTDSAGAVLPGVVVKASDDGTINAACFNPETGVLMPRTNLTRDESATPARGTWRGRRTGE